MKPTIRVHEPTVANRTVHSRANAPWKALICWATVVALAVIILVTAEKHGPASPENRNPDGVGKPPPVEPLLYPFDWVFWGQIAGAVLAAGIIVASVRVWRRHPGHPVVLMVLASSTLIWWDPINNWAIGLVYNPNLWHFPRDWPWFNISPVIEPLTSFVYAPYVLLPYFLAMPMLRSIQRRSEPKAFVSRHPLISIAVLTFVIGVIWDAAQEILLTRAQFLTYSHVVEFGSIDVGKNSQFPLMMASVLITVVMIPASVLLYRDDTGKSQAEKLARATAPACSSPKVGHLSGDDACPEYRDDQFQLNVLAGSCDRRGVHRGVPVAVPTGEDVDPRGYYESEGAPGPFTAGKASTWQIAQRDGRPADITVENPSAAS